MIATACKAVVIASTQINLLEDVTKLEMGEAMKDADSDSDRADRGKFIRPTDLLHPIKSRM